MLRAKPTFRLGMPIALEALLGSTIAVACTALVAEFIASFLSIPDLVMIFLPAVLFSAVMWGLWASIYAAILSVLLYDFFFVPPQLTFSIASPEDVLALVMFLVVAVLISNLTARMRANADALRRRENRTATLYALSQQLASSAGLEQVVQAVADHVAQVLAAKAVVLLPDPSGLQVKAAQPPGETLDPNEWAASMWVWQHDEPAGPGSEMLPESKRLYVPLTTSRGTVGVLGVRLASPGDVLSADQRRLLQAMVDQAAVSIERAHLAQDMAEARSLAGTERLRSALLSSVSHDLRTPLTSIIGAVTGLLSFDAGYDEASRHDLLVTIKEEAERLNHFVGNLLDITRLESGALQLHREWVEIGDIIGSALARMEQRLSAHRLTVQVEPGLPLLWLDFVLIEQVLVNVLDNAAKYSPAGTTIQVHARRAGGAVEVDIADEGMGMPPADLERIFDKFYRVRRGDHQVAGSGLGLSICKGIVEAHGGRIAAHLRSNAKGAVFTVTFPVQKGPTVTAEGEAAHA